jgi:colicin import membrane protein
MGVMIPTYPAMGGNRRYVVPFGLSFAAHALVLALIVYSPSWERSPAYIPSVINVQMVDLSDLGGTPAPEPEVSSEPAPEEPLPKPSEPPAPKVETKAAATPEVSVAPPRKATKKAMKYKTFKKKKVIKNVIRRVEKKVDTQQPKPLEDTIKRLKEKVAKEGKPSNRPTGEDVDAEAKGKSGFFSRGSKKEIEVIDLYRLEIAYAVQKNWAFAEQLRSGGKQLVASIVFKVMKDGEVTDLFFTDRSGNRYLDDSAYKAIVKSSPVKPHPKGLARPYIEMGLRFTPEGVR